MNHIWDQHGELFGICLLNCLQVVADCLEGSKSDLERWMIECFSENSQKVAFELVEVVNNIGEETIKDLKSRVNEKNVVWVDKLKDKVEEFLPDGFVFVFIHASCNFDQKVAEFVD